MDIESMCDNKFYQNKSTYGNIFYIFTLSNLNALIMLNFFTLLSNWTQLYTLYTWRLYINLLNVTSRYYMYTKGNNWNNNYFSVGDKYVFAV